MNIKEYAQNNKLTPVEFPSRINPNWEFETDTDAGKNARSRRYHGVAYNTKSVKFDIGFNYVKSRGVWKVHASRHNGGELNAP